MTDVPKLTTTVNYDELSPDIRNVVRMLREYGFDTTDSGDGSRFAAGDEQGYPVPMVAIKVSPADLVSETDRLLALLRLKRIPVTAPGPELGFEVCIEASYEPCSGLGLIVLTGLDDTLLAQKSILR